MENSLAVLRALKQGYVYTEWRSRDGLEKQPVTHLIYDKKEKIWCLELLEKSKINDGLYVNCIIWTSDYKKTWWLKKNQKE